jgi:hypothetical protein
MATQDNLQALFGGTMLPEEMQQQLLNQRAQQFAQLTPSQQLGVMGYKAGAGLGQGLAQAMGVDITDPAIKRMSTLRALSQGVENTSEGMTQFAQKLRNAGFAAEASQAMDKAREIAKTESETTLKGAQAEKALRTAGATTVSERNREMIANAEIKLAKGEGLTPEEEARVRWLVGQENKPKVFRDSETGEITTIEPIDLVSSAPNIASLVGKTAKPQAGGGVGSTVSTTPATKLSSTIKKEVGNVDEQMTALDTSVNKITELTPKIQNLNLGLYQNVERGVSGFLGKPTADTKEFKQLQREVRAQANNLLLLAKGTQTEGDAQRAKDQIADEDTWKNKDLLTSAFDDLAKTLAGTKKALEAKRTTLTSSGVPAIPGLSASDIAPKKSSMSGANPQLQPEPTAPKATHRYNPATGRVEAL